MAIELPQLVCEPSAGLGSQPSWGETIAPYMTPDHESPVSTWEEYGKSMGRAAGGRRW